MFGVDPTGAGVPTTVVEGRLPAGEDDAAASDEALADEGVGLGSTVSVGDVAVEVVGFVADASYQLQPTVWTTLDTWRDMRDSRASGAAPAQPTTSTRLRCARLTTLADGDRRGSPGTAVLTAEQTGLAIPGVEQQKSTLNTIIYITLAVAALVVALFFALLVLEKRELFAALKALGTPTGKPGSGSRRPGRRGLGPGVVSGRSPLGCWAGRSRAGRTHPVPHRDL